jgi:hypothetical protein
MLHEKLWPSRITRRMIKWSIHNTTTSRAEPEKE